jgi:hypothetical protein
MNEMPTMPNSPNQLAEWPLLIQVRGMLLSADFDNKAGQEKSCCNAGGNIKIFGKSWAGKGLGIRGPEIDETPLSQDEVRFAFKKGLV